MHLAYDVGHSLELLSGRPDDHVDALTEDVEVAVRHERSNLDEQIAVHLEPGHLAVDPHQSVAHGPTLRAEPGA